jgi:hypothetical protein
VPGVATQFVGWRIRDLRPYRSVRHRCDAYVMKGWFTHRGGLDVARLDDELPALGRRLTGAERACCCPARPVVTVVMPPVPGRPHPVDLLLCGHHYHASHAALHAAGAAVYDEAGFPITADGGEQPPAGRQPAAATRSRSGP